MTTLLMPPNALDPLLATAGDHDAIEASHASVLDEAFVQFYLCIHSFSTARKVDGLETTFDGQVISEDLVDAGKAKLIPSAWALPISSAARKLRELVRLHCLSGDGKSHYLINVERATAFFEAFNNLKAEHDAAADTLAVDYATIKDEIRDKWRTKIADDLAYQQAIGKLLPETAKEVRERYEIEYRLVVRGDGTIGGGARTLRVGPVREWFELAHQRALTHVAEQRRARYREPIDRLRQGLVGLRAQIASGTKVGPDTFTAFEQTLVLFDVCVDIIAPELVETVRGLAVALAAVKEEASRLMLARTGRKTFTSVVQAQQANLSAMIDRVVRDCEAATTADAIAAQLGRVPRALTLAR